MLSALGDELTRWTLVAGVILWSIFIPDQSEVSTVAFLPPCAIGALILFRLLTRRNVSADGVTYKLWAIWCISFYPVPWIRHVSYE